VEEVMSPGRHTLEGNIETPGPSSLSFSSWLP
jgi:hypothetical protein